jgi:outer membrane protein
MNNPFKMLFPIFAACGCCIAPLLAANGDPGAKPETRVLTVQEAVKMTLARSSPEALLAEAKAARARQALRESRSLNLPQVVTGTGLAYNNGFPLSIEGAAPSIFQVGAVKPILSKKNNNLIREAEESAKAGQIGKEAARNELASRTALAYYELYRARKIIALASAGLASATKQLELAEASLGAGKVRPVDVTFAKNAIISARQQLLVAREQENLAEVELRELTGLSEAISIQTQEPRIDSSIFESDADALYEIAIEKVPEILQADANVRAKTFHVEAEKGERLPRMEIVGQYALFSRTNNYEDYFNRFARNNYLLGLSIQFPIFDGFRASAKIAQSRQEVSEESYKLQRMKSDLKLNIQRGLSALRIAHGAFDLALSESEAAKEMVQVNETLLASGRVSAKEIEESRLQVQQKELALISAGQSLFQRKLELLQLVGSLTSAIQ